VALAALIPSTRAVSVALPTRTDLIVRSGPSPSVPNGRFIRCRFASNEGPAGVVAGERPLRLDLRVDGVRHPEMGLMGVGVLDAAAFEL
jgi:hypothetical protein